MAHNNGTYEHAPLTDRQRYLLGLAEENGWDPAVFAGLDIDGESVFVLRLLAELGARNRWKGVEESVKNRLAGLRKHYQIGFQAAFPYAVELFSAWNANGIPFFLFRNAALRLGGYFDNRLDHHRFSVFLPEPYRKQAEKIAAEIGFTAALCTEGPCFEKGVCKVLSCTDPGAFAGMDPMGILERSEKVEIEAASAGRIRVRIPCPEDMLLLWVHSCGTELLDRLDGNELMFLLWGLHDIRKRADLQKIRLPERKDVRALLGIIFWYAGLAAKGPSEEFQRLMQKGFRMTEIIRKEKGLRRFSVRACRKWIRIRLKKVLGKEENW